LQKSIGVLVLKGGLKGKYAWRNGIRFVFTFLARELNMDTADLLRLCIQQGFEVKNQLSNLDPDQQQKLEDLVKKQSKSPTAPAAPAKPVTKVGVAGRAHGAERFQAGPSSVKRTRRPLSQRLRSRLPRTGHDADDCGRGVGLPRRRQPPRRQRQCLREKVPTLLTKQATPAAKPTAPAATTPAAAPPPKAEPPANAGCAASTGAYHDYHGEAAARASCTRYENGTPLAG